MRCANSASAINSALRPACCPSLSSRRPPEHSREQCTPECTAWPVSAARCDPKCYNNKRSRAIFSDCICVQATNEQRTSERANIQKRESVGRFGGRINFPRSKLLIRSSSRWTRTRDIGSRFFEHARERKLRHSLRIRASLSLDAN